MKKFVIWLLIAFAFFGSIVYFVFSSDKSLTITYIKFNINPEFIIGVNNNDEVKIYNPLNEDAKVLNLGMFNGRSLEKSIEIILDKLEEKEFLDDSRIDITVITKNQSKINYYYEKIVNVINEQNYNLDLINNKASYDELLTYSNEVSYDLKASFNQELLYTKTILLQNEIKDYVNNLLNDLEFSELEPDVQKDVIEHKNINGYFTGYDLSKYLFVDDSNLIILDSSNYLVDFTYGEDGISYNITLNLFLEYQKEQLKNEKVYQIIEEYSFVFKNEQINNLKVNFYKFN